MHVAQLCPQCRTEISETLLPVNFFACPKCGLVAERTKLVTEKHSRWMLAGQAPGNAVTPLAPAIDTVTDWSFVLQGAPQSTTGDIAIGPLVANSTVLTVLAWDASANLTSFTANGSITATQQSPVVLSNIFIGVVPMATTSMTFNAAFDAPASWIALYCCQLKPATGMGQVLLDRNAGRTRGVDPSRTLNTASTTQSNEAIVGVLITEGTIADTQPTWDSPFVRVNRVGTAFSPATANATIDVGQYKTTTQGTFTAGSSNLSGRSSYIWCGTFK